MCRASSASSALKASPTVAGVRPRCLAGEATLAQRLPVLQKPVVFLQPLLIRRPLELEHARPLGVREDGGLLAPDHGEHVLGAAGRRDRGARTAPSPSLRLATLPPRSFSFFFKQLFSLIFIGLFYT